MLIDLIRKSNSLKELCSLLNCSYNEFYKYKLSDGEKLEVSLLRKRSREFGHRFNQGEKRFKFFDYESNDFWYFLGFYCGDGCVSYRGVGRDVQIQSTDIGFLERLSKAVSSSNKISVSEGKRNLGKLIWKDSYLPVGKVRLSGTSLWEKMSSLGLVEKKSIRRDWNIVIEERYMNSFLRGLLDSDGSLWRYKNYLYLYFVSSSESLLKNISYLLSKRFNTDSKPHKFKTIYKLQYSAVVARSVFSLIYGEELWWDMKSKREKGRRILKECECLEGKSVA